MDLRRSAKSILGAEFIVGSFDKTMPQGTPMQIYQTNSVLTPPVTIDLPKKDVKSKAVTTARQMSNGSIHIEKRMIMRNSVNDLNSPPYQQKQLRTSGSPELSIFDTQFREESTPEHKNQNEEGLGHSKRNSIRHLNSTWMGPAPNAGINKISGHTRFNKSRQAMRQSAFGKIKPSLAQSVESVERDQSGRKSADEEEDQNQDSSDAERSAGSEDNGSEERKTKSSKRKQQLKDGGLLSPIQRDELIDFL